MDAQTQLFLGITVVGFLLMCGGVYQLGKIDGHQNRDLSKGSLCRLPPLRWLYNHGHLKGRMLRLSQED